MLTSARRQFQQQQRIVALGERQALRLARRSSRAAAVSVTAYQLASVNLALETAPLVLQEQGIATDAVAAPVARSLLTDTSDLATMMDSTATADAFARLVRTMVTDASRSAQSVDNATRPAVTSYVRSLVPPSCSRCAVLAGRVYRHSQGFQRHPRCDCLMTPTTQAAGRDLVTKPMDLFEKGQIRGLSKADTEAVTLGADLGQVVNVRRTQAGLTVGSSVIERAGRLTPEGIFRLASDREEQLRLLRQFRYIT